MSARHQRLQAVFFEACELAEQLQLAFVQEACGDDVGLAEEVLALLAADRRDSLLDAPAEVVCREAGPEALPQLERYEQLHPIASGGMGTVYRAEQRQPVRRTVALKILRRGLAEGAFLARFAEERQLVARLVHTGIAQLYDSGVTADGCPFFAMELVDGEPITTFCDRGRLDLVARVRLLASVCDAVHYAHEQRVVHRDLKPANVLAKMQDGRPLAKVIDFGIAQSPHAQSPHGQPPHQQVAILGTAGYLSPERQGGAAGGVSSDVFALGVLLGELLVGRAPAAGETSPCSSALVGDAARVDATARERGLTTARLVRECRRDLDWIVARAIAMEPQHRYASARELAVDLRRYLAAVPIAARPRTVGYVFQRLWQRRRAAVVAASVVLAGLPMAFVVSQSGWLAARRNHASLDAASQMLIERGSDRELARLPGSDPTRTEMLRSGLELAELALQQRPGDPKLQDRVFRARRGWATLMIELGRLPEAEQALRLALQEDVPSVHRLTRASAQISLIATLRSRGDVEAARACAAALLDELAAHEGPSWPQRSLTSSAWREQCLNARRSGDHDEALAAARKALEYAAEPAGPEHRKWHLWNFIDCQKMLGEQLARLPASEADADYAACFASAVARLEELMQEPGWRGDPKLQHHLALLYGSWSYADAKRANVAAVDAHLHAALAIVEPMTLRFPDRVPYQETWLRLVERKAYLSEKVGQPEVALSLLREAVQRAGPWLERAPEHKKLAWRVQLVREMLERRQQ